MNSKYFKYAIGEIILVVIGILIALAINDFNQGLKDKKKYKRLAEDLIIEFNTNLQQIEEVQRYQEESLNATYRLIALLDKSKEATNDSLPKWIGNTGNNWSFDAQNGVLKTAISSGDIHLLKSDSLKNFLFGWEGLTIDLKEEQDRAVEAFDRLNAFVEKYIQIADAIYFYRNQFPKSKFKSDFEGLLMDPQFEDLLINRGLFLLDQLNELKDLKTRNELIINYLKKEI